MNYNIPPIEYIRRYEPVDAAKVRSLDVLCRELDSNFDENAQQVSIAAAILIMPLRHLRAYALSDSACCDIMRMWKAALISDLAPEFLQFDGYANFVRAGLRKFADFVQSSRQLLLQTIHFVPTAKRVVLPAPIRPCGTLAGLSAAELEQFYIDRKEQAQQQNAQICELERQNIYFSAQKMAFEDKFAYFLRQETDAQKYRTQNERERASAEKQRMAAEEGFSRVLSVHVYQHLAERREQRMVEELVQERLSKLQADLAYSAKALSGKKK